MTVSLLFYSNYCQHCKQIVNEINKSPVSPKMRYVCIDTQEVRENYLVTLIVYLLWLSEKQIKYLWEIKFLDG